MKRAVTQQLNLIGKNTLCRGGLAFLLTVMLIIPASATAGKDVVYEGTMQGASCVHYKLECPEDEAHIAIEHDFVLLRPDGEHYFLTNLSRITKARYATRSVRVSGEIKDHEIWVDKLEVKEGDQYRQVWSWKQQQEMYKGGGG